MDSDHDYFTPRGGKPQQLSLVDLDRDRGILTPADRRLLVGESDIEHGSTSERKARQRIRERIRESMRDFYLLLNHLEDRDLAQAFGQDGSGRTYDDVTSVFPAALGFLYAASTIHRDAELSEFEHRLRHGIAAAEVARRDNTVDVEVSIEVTPKKPLDEIAERVKEKGGDADVTTEEMHALLQAGKIDRDRFAKVMEELLQ